MTVRLVAILAIAFATVLGAAPQSWAQVPYGQQPPRLTPPDEVQGMWVSDDQQETEQPEMLPGQQYTGMVDEGSLSPYTDGSFLDDGSGAVCSDDGGEYCEGDGEGCDPGAGYPGMFGGHGKRHGACGGLFCPGMDLWEDVHAHHRVYVQADYLSMWAKGNYLPPLVTTSPPGTPQAQAGVLPVSATTSILFGNDRVDTGQRNGGRINVGYWLIDGEFLGIEGQYLALQTQNTNFFAESNGDPILARPFTDFNPIHASPVQNAALIAFNNYIPPGTQTPTNLSGSIDIRTVSNIQSANMTLRRLVWIDFTMQRRVDLLLGYRFFYLEDSVTIDDEFTIQPVGITPLTHFTGRDQFRSRNQFNGGEIGMKYQSYHGPFQLEFIGKCAFGNNRERTWINGSHTTQVNGGAIVEGAGNLLALPSNIGSYRRDVFAILPEADVNLRMNITCNLRLTAGYTFIYTNRVQRSGDAISLNVNPTQINGALVGDAVPAFTANDTPFWVHGYNAGVEYRW
ncbi:MAG: BBP7 family outer membrane beta-barrel protein [Pirellulales bacterium]